VLVDLNGLDELDFIRREDDGRLRFGSMTRQSTLERNELVAEHAPLLHETIPFIAHPQIRNRGTLGGSIAHADPAAELPVVAVALNGRFKLQKVHNQRWVNAQAFFTTLFETACEDEEILTEIELPSLPAHTGTAFQEVARRHGDYALGGVAAVITLAGNGTCTQARLVYLNAGDVPMVAAQAAAMLVGGTVNDELLTAVAEAAQAEIDPTGDIHASADYKRHLAKVLTIRTLKQAFARASA